LADIERNFKVTFQFCKYLRVIFAFRQDLLADIDDQRFAFNAYLYNVGANRWASRKARISSACGLRLCARTLKFAPKIRDRTSKLREIRKIFDIIFVAFEFSLKTLLSCLLLCKDSTRL